MKLSKNDFDTLEKMPPVEAFQYFQALRNIDAWERERPDPPPIKCVVTRKIARNIARREMKKNGMRHIIGASVASSLITFGLMCCVGGV
ncbi:MAG: hypothetical protein IJH36_10055 [Clostridia bacterium]|nr:hypothetical protein [Clostridia bacterium]MBQ6529496.1 hypothetical protein [Clostridia bacterium]